MSAAVAGLRSIRPTRSYTNTRDVTFGLLSRSLRPAIVGTAHEVRGLSRELRETFGARYAH
jgi:hypothetical protein